jgi:predicted GNAT superfamily acetyltransferase
MIITPSIIYIHHTILFLQRSPFHYVKCAVNEDPSAGVADLFVAIGLFLKCLGLLSQVRQWIVVRYKMLRIIRY